MKGKMKTMIIDNDVTHVPIYEYAGVDRLFVDLEILGKEKRQPNNNTVISKHTVGDIAKVKSVLHGTELLVRVNPIHDNSGNEIDSVIENGADIIMLPMFKTAEEVSAFVKYVGGRARTCLLFETSQSLCRVDDILSVTGIDEAYVGLNDLHLSLGLDFMFELLGGGLIEFLGDKFKSRNIPFGIGGIAGMDSGDIKGRTVMREYVRLGAEIVILSRAFKNYTGYGKDAFKGEMEKLHDVVEEAKEMSLDDLLLNKRELAMAANKIADNKRRQ